MTNLFCPPQQIQDKLQEYRLSIDATCAVLVAFDRASILKHLAFVSMTDTNAENEIRDRISHLDRERIVGLEFDKLSERGLLSGDEILKLVEHFGAPFAKMFNNAYMRLPPPHSDALGVVLLDNGPSEASSNRALLDELREMVNGTALANVRREQHIGRMIRRADSHYLIPGESSNEQHTRLQRSLLKLATSVVPGAVAAYYAPDQTTLALRRAGIAPEENVLGSVPTTVELKPLVDLPVDSVENYIRLAFIESKTYLSPGPSELASNLGSLSSGDTGFAVLPVPSAALGRDAVNLGVLAVWRPLHGNGQAQITQFEIALLRNVALRLALTSDSERAGISGEYLAKFAASLSATNTDLARQLDTQLEVSRVPWDVEVSHQSMSNLAENLWRATYSDSVSVRILVTEQGEHDDLEFHLRKFIAVPAGSADMEDENIPLTGTSNQHIGRRLFQESASAFAAVTGREVHIRNMQGNISAQCPGLIQVGDVESRNLVGSTYCMPIFVDGAIIGTIRLQSPFRNAYMTQLPTIRAFGALAGVAIATTRREIVRHVSLRFASLRIGHHEAKNIAELLTSIETEAPDQVVRTSELRKLTLGQDVYTAEATEEGQLAQGRTTLRDVIFNGSGPLRDSYLIRVPDELTLSERAARLLEYATGEILRNIQRHSTTGSAHVVSVRCYRLALGGDQQVCITFRSLPKSALVEEFLRTAYRAPIPDTNGGIRPHLGCFSAGQMVRVIGGNVFMDVTTSGFVETHILLPSHLFE